MRNLKDEIGRIFGLRGEGSSEAQGKRRSVKPGSPEWFGMDRPRSLCRVLGFIPSFQQKPAHQ